MSADLLPTATFRETFSFLRRIVWANRRATVSALTVITLAGVAGLVSPWMLGSIVDDVRSGRDTIVSSVLIIAAASVAAALFGGLSVTLLARAGEPALAELREEVLDRSLHLRADEIERATSGDLLSRLDDDVRMVSQGLRDVVPLVVNSAVAVVFTSAGVFALDWRLGLAMLSAAPLYVLGLRWYLPRSAPLYRAERVAQGERAEALLSGVQTAPTARAFGIETAALGRVEQTSQKAVDLSVAAFRLILRFLGRNNLAELVGLGMVLGVGFVLVRNHLTTVGAVTAAALYFLRLFGPIGGLLFTFDQFQAVGVALSRLVGIAAIPRPSGSAPTTPTESGEVVLAGVGHEYKPGKPVLQGINVRIAVGERIAVVGATGAGKTTLGAIAAGVLRPTHGTVTVGGVPYDPARSDTSSRVCLVTQEVHAFAGTVRDSLTLAKPGLWLHRHDLGHAPGTAGLRGLAGEIHAMARGLSRVM